MSATELTNAQWGQEAEATVDQTGRHSARLNLWLQSACLKHFDDFYIPYTRTQHLCDSVHIRTEKVNSNLLFVWKDQRWNPEVFSLA